MNFEELAQLVHKDRVRQEREEQEDLENRVRIIYSNFCIWCRVQDKYATEEEMNNYLREEYPDLPFYLKKKLLEKYFGYTFTFNYDTNKWQSKKNNAI